MTRQTIAILALILSVALGCVRASVQPLSSYAYAPIPIDSVTVFLGVEELVADSIAYERIALIHLEGSQVFSDQEALFRRARKEAAQLGANGVLFTGMEEGKTTWNWLTGTTTSNRQAQAFAVRWRVQRP